MTAASNHLFPIDKVSEDVYVSSDTTGSTLDVSLSVDTDDLEPPNYIQLPEIPEDVGVVESSWWEILAPYLVFGAVFVILIM